MWTISHPAGMLNGMETPTKLLALSVSGYRSVFDQSLYRKEASNVWSTTIKVNVRARGTTERVLNRNELFAHETLNFKHLAILSGNKQSKHLQVKSHNKFTSLGRAIYMGYIQLSGSILSLPLVGLILPLSSSVNISPYCPPTHAIIIIYIYHFLVVLLYWCVSHY